MNPAHQKLIDIWQQQFQDDEDVRMPLITESLKGDRLLFVGLNPSWPDDLEANEWARNFFDWRNRAEFDFDKAVRFEQNVRNPNKPYPYFKQFIEIAAYVGVEWEDIDLYFYREKNQAVFNARIEGEWKAFGDAQLRLSTQRIREASPRIIVVANAYASRIFEREFEAVFSDEHGCHLADFGSRKVPIFLASMLSGQRAMDVYSRQRLKWHIKKVYTELYGRGKQDDETR